LVFKEGCEQNVIAIKKGLENLPAGQRWAKRKLSLFDENSIEVALTHLKKQELYS
jgi:hypothetical protein